MLHRSLKHKLMSVCLSASGACVTLSRLLTLISLTAWGVVVLSQRSYNTQDEGCDYHTWYYILALVCSQALVNAAKVLYGVTWRLSRPFSLFILSTGVFFLAWACEIWFDGLYTKDCRQDWEKTYNSLFFFLTLHLWYIFTGLCMMPYMICELRSTQGVHQDSSN